MNMKRTLISLTLVIAQITVGLAQQMTVTVDSVGQLSKQLPDSIRYTISELKICGPLNGSDLKIIQLMTSRLKAKKPTDAVLTSLDLSEATITESKGGFRTRADLLPAAMFLNCKALEKVALPNGTNEVSRSCFSGCVSLKEVIIPENVRIINDYAFNGCVNLASITLPYDLQTIENHAFDGCVGLLTYPRPLPVSTTTLSTTARIWKR